MFSVPSACGRCNELVDFIFENAVEHTQLSHEQIAALRQRKERVQPAFLVKTIRDSDPVDACALSHCPRCQGPSLIVFECSRQLLGSIKEIIAHGEGSIFGGSSGVAVKEVHPSPKRPESDPDWPDDVIPLFKDAQNMLAQKMTPSIIIGVCRTVVDISTKKFDATDANFHNRINQLRSKNVITEPIADWAHTIRSLGNDAVHDGKGTAAEAHELVEFLRMFLNMAFSLPKRIEKRKLSTPAV